MKLHTEAISYVETRIIYSKMLQVLLFIYDVSKLLLAYAGTPIFYLIFFLHVVYI